VLRCRGGSYYTGIAKDVAARLAAHRAGRGAACTRSHPPEALLYRESGRSRSEALMREARIKALPRPAKQRLTEPAETGRQRRSWSPAGGRGRRR
jgi:putative endonuclease